MRSLHTSIRMVLIHRKKFQSIASHRGGSSDAGGKAPFCRWDTGLLQEQPSSPQCMVHRRHGCMTARAQQDGPRRRISSKTSICLSCTRRCRSLGHLCAQKVLPGDADDRLKHDGGNWITTLAELESGRGRGTGRVDCMGEKTTDRTVEQ